MSNSKSIFPKGSIAFENELKPTPANKSDAQADTFFPKTSIALENEQRATRVTPGAGKGFLPD
ncbi:hypothetical protein ACODM8_16205 [Vibrio ostreicida]|uniref:hypothetical protein n=1 Tax=Vibrio ostreicida TaxID=526588 RepID=UPI00117C9013|nr:hypothetical protein [Vibrio ostreicida]NPD10151.1 hypothetical protein [Vibrio ostreicida]